MSKRFRRRDKHPTIAGLVFFRYGRGKEVWVTPEQLEDKIKKSRVIAKRGRARPENKIKARHYMRKYQQRPERKAKHSAYYKQSHVRERVKEKWNSDPKTISRRKERARIKAERKAYLESEEYKEQQRELHRQWAKDNRDKINAYETMRYNTDPNYKLAKNMRSRIGSVLRGRAGAKKTLNTEQLIGCSIEALRLHLESQFTEGMSVEALMSGAIHADHHLPCAAFDLTRVDQQLICFNYRNLKPMWAKPNFQKSDKMIVDGKEVRGRDLRKQNIIPFQKTA